MAHLSLQFLGPFQATLNGHVLTGFESNKVRALLAYLAVESDRPHPRESLAALLWPNYLNRSAVNNLRSVLANLRQILGDRSTDSPFLIITREAIQFNPTADYCLDVDVFDAAVGAQVKQAELILDTYRGEFLEGFSLPDNSAFEEWLQGRRERLQQQMLAALDSLATLAMQQSAYGEVVTYARRQLEMDNLCESAYRQLMLALAHLGQRTEAVAQYELCAHLLRVELNIEPSAETHALAQRIAAEEIDPLATEATAGSASLAGKIEQRHNLPLQLSSFIGREDQLADLLNLLANPNVRLITVTGPGGIGKTRLALEAARRCAPTYRHGVFFISLGSAKTYVDMIERLIVGLGLRATPSIPNHEAVLNLLQNKNALLVLDTLEHLLPDVDIISRIRESAPQVQILATSRSALRLSGEYIFIVPPMSNSEPGADPATLWQSDAMALFEERAREVQPDFAVSASNAAEVTEICRLLGGLPLGLEMAAAHTRTLSLRQLRQQLSSGDELLTGGRRDVPSRHRSIRDTLSWSYDLLTPAQQALFRSLGVFSEGCTLAAAEAVAPERAIGRGEFIDNLSGLIDQSMVHTQTLRGRRIYRLHEISLRFAHEQLLAGGEFDQTMSKLLDYILNLAEQVDQHFRDPSRHEWLALFEPEAGYVWQALDWGLSSGDASTVTRCLTLTGRMLQYWNVRGQHDLARQWTEQALQRGQELDIEKSVLGLPLITVASMALVHADIQESLDHAESALQVARETGDTPLEVRALHLIGLCAFARAELELAETIWKDALDLAEHLGVATLLSTILDDLGNLAARRGDFEQAIGFHLREQEVSLEAADLYSEFYAVLNLGEVFMLMERPADAAMYYERALKICRELNDSRGLAQTMITQATLMIQLQRPAEALALLREVIVLAWDIQNLDIVLRGLELILHSDVVEMSLETRARFAGALSHLSEKYSSASLPTDKEALVALRGRLSQEMSASVFTLEWRVGRSYNWEQAVELAREITRAGKVILPQGQ